MNLVTLLSTAFYVARVRFASSCWNMVSQKSISLLLHCNFDTAFLKRTSWKKQP